MDQVSAAPVRAGVSPRRRYFGLAVLLAVLVAGWLLLARLGMFAAARFAIGSNIPGQRYSFAFIPAGKFCNGADERCFFVDLGARLMTPALKGDRSGVDFSITDSITPAADFKASFETFTFEIVVQDGDTLRMRSDEVEKGAWRTYSRRR